MIPILLAVPAIILIAASSVAAFKSGIFVSAICLIASLLTVATFVLLGVPEAFSIFAAFFKSTAAGGVFVMNVKDLSA